MSEGPPKLDVTSDDRMWAVLSHLSNFVVPIFGPLVIWLVKKDDSPFVDDQAKEALNFQLAVWIVTTVSVLTCVLAPVGILVPIVAMVMSIMAAVEANKGAMTVEYLLNRCYPLKTGEHALFYAASGGVGLFAGQWGRHIGAKMIGVAAGAEKCRMAKDNGYAEVIDRTKEDVVERVKAITGGARVPVVYDSVGKATFDASLKCLKPRGFFVSFGTTTGAPPPIEAGTLQKLGSLYFTRPTLVTYTAAREELVASANAVFDLWRRGVLNVTIGQRYALADAAKAHADLEAGRTVGSSVLIP